MSFKPIPPPPPTTQGIDTRQFRDWFYTLFQTTNGNLNGLGSMAFENSDNVSITGGAVSGIGLSNFTTPGLTGYLKGNGSSSNVSASTTIPSADISGLGTMSTQNANNVTITGGTINGTSIGATTPAAGYFTTTLQRNGYTVKPNCYIEAYDLSSSISISTTPTLLKPANTLSGATGISYDSSTGVFTFSQEGDYSLSLLVNALSTSGNRILYIYAEKNTGSGWTVNANSGKIYNLVSTQITQIVYANSIHRAAGEQTRYWIYSNNTNVTLQTQTLPSVTGVYVPAIRIQYR